MMAYAVVMAIEEAAENDINLLKDGLKKTKSIGTIQRNADLYILYQTAEEQMKGFKEFSERYTTPKLISNRVNTGKQFVYMRRPGRKNYDLKQTHYRESPRKDR